MLLFISECVRARQWRKRNEQHKFLKHDFPTKFNQRWKIFIVQDRKTTKMETWCCWPWYFSFSEVEFFYAFYFAETKHEYLHIVFVSVSCLHLFKLVDMNGRKMWKIRSKSKQTQLNVDTIFPHERRRNRMIWFFACLTKKIKVRSGNSGCYMKMYLVAHFLSVSEIQTILLPGKLWFCLL